jgi:hypothetical protein
MRSCFAAHHGASQTREESEVDACAGSRTDGLHLRCQRAWWAGDMGTRKRFAALWRQDRAAQRATPQGLLSSNLVRGLSAALRPLHPFLLAVPGFACVWAPSDAWVEIFWSGSLLGRPGTKIQQLR